MISSSWFFSKWRISPTVVKFIPNCTLMVELEPFQFRLVGPHNPAVQGLIELACPHQPLTDPVVETGAWDVQHTG